MPFDSLELRRHYAKHAVDFGASTPLDYERLADQFMTKPKTVDVQECIRTRGDLVRHDVVTTEYAVKSSGGLIRTYFKPRPCSSLPAEVPKGN